MFEKEKVVEHILITDYARLIIEYAITLGSEQLKEYRRYLPPYNTYKKIPVCSDAYIVKKYDKPYDEHKDKKVSSSVWKMLASMKAVASRSSSGCWKRRKPPLKIRRRCRSATTIPS